MDKDRERRVFISSTKEDLAKHRQCVIAAIEEAGFEPVPMEKWGAEGLAPLQKCRETVRSCARFVGIVAWMIGSNPPGETRSFTECEYEEAVRDVPPGSDPTDEKIHIFPFLQGDKEEEEKYGWPPEYVDKDRTRVEAFRKRLERNHMCAYFTSPENLAKKVLAALSADLARERGRDRPRGKKGRFQVGIPFDPVRCFLDRKPQLASARDYLQDPNTVLVCVVGRGGYGKTALVSKVCLDMQERKEIDGIAYRMCMGTDKLSLERVFRDFGELLGGESQKELLEACNERSRSVADKTRFLLEMVGERRYVYALDNLEALMDGKGEIVDDELREFVNVVLTARHNVKLVASSRVTPLIMPPATLAAWIISLDEGLPLDDAVSLVRELDRHSFMRPKIVNPTVEAEIARKCQGLPRALQLFVSALQRQPRLSCRDLLENDALFGPYVIENLLREHYESLSEEERRTVEALAVLGGPVTSRVIAAVVKRVMPSVNVADCLDRLCRYETVTCLGEDAMVLQALDRQYIIPQMRARADNDKFCLKSWYHRAADYYKEASKPVGQQKSEEDIQPVLEEIRHRTLAEEFAEAAELIDTIDDAHLFPWGHFRTLVSIREPLVGKIKDPKHIQQNLGRLGNAYRVLGRRDDAISMLKEAIQIAECKGYGEGQSEWLAYLGHTYADAAHFAEAHAAYEKGIAVAKAAGAKRNEAECVGAVAILCRQTGKIEKAIENYEQAITLDKELKDDRLLCKHTGNLACAYVALGDCEKAKDLFKEALRMAKELEFNQALAFDHFDMSRACLQLEEFEEAKSHCRESLKTCETTGEKRCSAYAFNGLGQAIHHQGNVQEAKGYYEQALELDVPEVSHRAAVNLGIVALAQGDPQKARHLFEDAVGYCKKLIEDFPLFYEAVYHRAVAELGLGATSGASKTLESALGICSAKGVLKEANQCLQLLERAKPDLAGLQEASEMLRAAADRSNADKG